MLRLQESRFYLLSQPNGAAIGLLQVRWSSLRRPYGCISRLRSITRCREIGQSGFSGYSTHMAIFLLIAGTYTPFTLGALRGAVDWTLFAAVWSLAILGIGFIVFGGLRFRRLSVCLYLGLGWLALFAARPLWLHVPLCGLLWLLAVGIAYTAGIVFYLAKRLAYSHFIWHLFVIAETSCHFCAVLWYTG